MNKPVRILGIAGSLRRASYNRAALREARRLVPDGATLDIFELEGIPGFNQDEEQNPPPKVTELKRRVREADAILIVTPEYNYSIPGVLKNAIDWASRPYGDSAWNGKRWRSWALRSEPSARTGRNTTCDRYSSF
jgi:chromate reductase